MIIHIEGTLHHYSIMMFISLKLPAPVIKSNAPDKQASRLYKFTGPAHHACLLMKHALSLAAVATSVFLQSLRCCN